MNSFQFVEEIVMCVVVNDHLVTFVLIMDAHCKSNITRCVAEGGGVSSYEQITPYCLHGPDSCHFYSFVSFLVCSFRCMSPLLLYTAQSWLLYVFLFQLLLGIIMSKMLL